jgi:hypothetical protein
MSKRRSTLPPMPSRPDKSRRISNWDQDGRPTYSNATPIRDITNMSDDQENSEMLETESMERRANIREYILRQGYNSVFDFCLKELQSGSDTRRSPNRQWLLNAEEGASKFLTVCLSHPRLTMSDSLITEICNKAESIYIKELEKLAGSDFLRQ